MPNSILEQNGSAGFGPYPVNFNLGYLRRSYVQLRVNNEVDGLGDPVYRTISWINDGAIQITSGTEPTAADTVVITRTVPDNLLIHDYQDGALIVEQNLDESNLQSIMLLHQILDGRLTSPLYNDLDMGFKRIVNLADGIDDTDAATVAQLNFIMNNPGIVAIGNDLTGPNHIGNVSANLSTITAVNNNAGNINIVAGDTSAINTVASNTAAVTNVSGNMTTISAVNANATNINTVASNATAVNTIATNMSVVTNVNSNLATISAVNSNQTNINTVASNSANINTTVANMAAIIAAPGFAQDAEDARDFAWAWSSTAEDAAVNDGIHSGYSAYHWAQKAAASASGSGAGLSILGVTGNATASRADIVAGTDAFVLRRSGTTLGFGTITTNGIANSAVTNGKIANMAANTVKVNATAGSAAPADLAMGASTILARLASGNIVAASVTQLLDLITGTPARGDVLFRGASSWSRLAAGTAGQALLTGGAGADPTWGSLGGTYLGTQTLTSSGTYTPTPGMKYCRVRLTGAGQSLPNTGGTITNSSSGATCIKWFTAAQIGASVSVTIGAAGLPAVILYNTKAGDSTFLTMTAGGGYSPQGAGDRVDTTLSTATGGDDNIPGTNGLVTASSKISLPQSYWNFGNIFAFVNNAVTNLPGCGAAGGPSSSNISGRSGICVIEEFG